MVPAARPLTAREMRVKNALLTDFMYAANELAATVRAIEIIAGMESTGLPVDPAFQEYP